MPSDATILEITGKITNSNNPEKRPIKNVMPANQIELIHPGDDGESVTQIKLVRKMTTKPISESSAGVTNGLGSAIKYFSYWGDWEQTEIAAMHFRRYFTENNSTDDSYHWENEGEILFTVADWNATSRKTVAKEICRINPRGLFVNTNIWWDSVFNDNYRLMTIENLEKYISQNKRLPEISTEETILKEGMNLTEITPQLIKKNEELTLYVIELNKKNKELENRLKALENE